ncbi:MAG: fibronectin type III domain-containing protein [Anaerolineae bacterium]|nr:fibronectin type III domain-containing protein [Phycisphaerae bacterium]
MLSGSVSAIDLNAPTNLAVSIGYREAPDGGTTRAHLSWTDTNTTEAGYRVEYSSDNGFSWNVIGADLVANSSSAAHVLDAGQKLYYRVSAVNGPSVSLPSASASPVTPFDRVVQVTATVYSDTIHLKWPYHPDAVSYNVYRKARTATTWTLMTPEPLAANNVGWAETVPQGQAFEYQVERITHNFYGPLDGTAFGYVYAGNRVALTESRGRVLLVVDQTRASAISAELTRYRRDLLSDGWTVQQITVARDNGDPRLAVTVRAQIQAAALAQTAPLKSIVLIGHVPVPYSGTTAWDGHTDHNGAWPADGYYGVGIGIPGGPTGWTDIATALNLTHLDNNNLPLDGKFDQNNLPGAVTVPVGRIDFANLDGMRYSFNPLPATVDESESALLRRYLDRNHQWRTRAWIASKTAIEDDHLGGGAAENGWRNFAPLVGALETRSADFQTTLFDTSNLFAAGIGPGSTEYAVGVLGTSQLHSPDAYVYSVFNLMSGSWFGDWNKPTNLLREMIAANGTSLVSLWAGTPNVFIHTMGLDETIGQGMMMSQNNTLSGPYSPASSGASGTHMGLMGDPTLTMSIVAPVTNLTSFRSANINSVSWSTPSDASITGFHIYRAESADGPFYRINSTAIPTAGANTSMSFTDPTPIRTYKKFTYMVRAIKMQTTPSGKFENASWGQTVQSQTINDGDGLEPRAPASPSAARTPLPATITKANAIFSAGSAIGSTFGSGAGLQADPLDDLGL